MSDPVSDDVSVPWLLLRQKDYVQAIELFRARYASERSPGRRLGLGEALMWAGEYPLAADHFRDSIAKDQGFGTSSEEDFAFLGSADWCLGAYESAVATWQSGTKALYSIGGGRTHCPLLLLVASILRPGLFQRARAEKILLQRLRNLRAPPWPVTLAGFVVGQVNEKALEDSWAWYVAQGIRGMVLSSKWIVGFYESLLTLGTEGMTKNEFRQTMSSMVDGPHIESCDLEDFTQLTWNPEFYIARHEACCTS
jgi:tetratricopeptide (TPR) repeat protein